MRQPTSEPDRPNHDCQDPGDTDAESLAIMADLVEELLPSLRERAVWQRAVARVRRLRQAMLLGEVLVLPPPVRTVETPRVPRRDDS